MHAEEKKKLEDKKKLLNDQISLLEKQKLEVLSKNKATVIFVTKR